MATVSHGGARARKRNWSADVHTTAIAVPEATMTRPAEEMARILLEHNQQATAGSINRYMQFYINRAGKSLPRDRKYNIQKAMEIIRNRG